MKISFHRGHRFKWNPARLSPRTNLIRSFINDLPDVCSSMCQLFADDAKISRNVSSSEEINELQDDLNRLMEWSEIWQLSFNLDKYKYLHIGRCNLKHVYKMKGENLKQVVDEKD